MARLVVKSLRSSLSRRQPNDPRRAQRLTVPGATRAGWGGAVRELRLEWVVSPSKSGFWYLCLMSNSAVQVVDDFPRDKWLWYVNREYKGSKDTLHEAQVAAEDALQAALLPYAQQWAKLAGVELPTLEVERPTEEVGE